MKKLKQSNLMFSCEICNKEYKSLGSLQKHITAKHSDVILEQYYNDFLLIDETSKFCKFCNNKATFFGFTKGYKKTCNSIECINKSMNPYSKEYKTKVDGLNEKEYEEWVLNDSSTRGKLIKKGIELKTEINPSFKKLNSRYCSEFWENKGYNIIESKEIAYKEIAKNREKFKIILKYDPNYLKERSVTNVKYWVNKGFTEEDAEKMISKRQCTFSLEKCIEKYGEIEGTNKWKLRQEKWLHTLDSKSDDEKLEILKKKLSRCNPYSKISLELFDSIKDISESNMSKSFRYGPSNGDVSGEMLIVNGKNTFSCDFTYKNKIIEFYGNYWHFNPKFYDAEYEVRRGGKTISAKNKWETDEHRIQALEKAGYDVLIIWENEYKSNKTETINKCISFIKDA